MPARTTKKSTAKPVSAVKAATRRAKRSSPPPPDLSPSHKHLSGNALVCADNMDVLKELPDECIDLIYLDPPFNSNNNYVAAFGDKGSVDAQLRDIWRWTVESEAQYQGLKEGRLRNAINAIRLVSGESSPMAAYALFMGRRLAELWRVLKPTGSIYLHCDPTANHYLKVLMDAVFGRNYFRNEIIWKRAYGVSHTTGRQQRFGVSTDSILYYVKGSSALFVPQFTMNDPQYQEYVENTFRHVDDKGRRYRIDNLASPSPRPNLMYDYKGYKPPPKGWAISREKMEEWDGDGRLHFPSNRNGRIQRRRFLDELKGKPVQNLWDDIQMIASQSSERVGYPTQKPLALLERIIQASSNPGDLVLDPFCGCGTAADAAAKLGRGYLGIDVSAIAVRVMEQRLASRGGAATPVVYKMGWEDYEWEAFERRALMHESDAEDGLPGWAWAEDKVAGLLNAVPNGKKVGDGGVDARYFTEQGAVIPVQVKMYQGQVGRPEMQKLLGVQTEWQNKKVNAPMSLMITLYPPRETLRVYAAQQGQVTLSGEKYPKMQVLSVQEMLTKMARPKLPPVDPRYFVGDSQTRFAMA